ncbi:MAG: amidase [Lysobacterales bacterium]
MTARDFLFGSACDLQARIRSRDLSCVEVVNAHLEQVNRVNPKLNALVTRVDSQALDRAQELDQRLQRGEDIGPLGGLPVAHKDLSSTQGVRTTFGTLSMANHVPTENSLVVQRMHDAGAIMLGKTNTPEYGAGSHTFNEIFGVTANPYDPTRSCGGSSGGAAVVLAAGMAALAEGSDMGGSLRNPAAWCNICGLRPTPGRVPMWPAKSPTATLPVEGPMARTIEDLALFMAVIGPPDPCSPLSQSLEPLDFSSDLSEVTTGLRIALAADYGGLLPLAEGMPDYVTEAARELAGLGAHIEYGCPDLSDADVIFKTLRADLYAKLLGDGLDNHRDTYKATLISNIEQGLALNADQVALACKQQVALIDRVSEFFTRYDFLLLPVTQVHPFPIEQEYPREIAGQSMDSYLDWMKSCYFITVAGNPALSVPAGFTSEGWPVGVQIVGRYGDDAGVLRLGYALQQATNHWRTRPSMPYGNHHVPT